MCIRDRLSGCRPTGFRYTLTGHIEGLNDSVALVESVTKDTLAVLPAPDEMCIRDSPMAR